MTVNYHTLFFLISVQKQSNREKEQKKPRAVTEDTCDMFVCVTLWLLSL